MKKLAIVLLTFLGTSSAMATDYYVSASGKNTNDGKTQNSAFQSIQKAADLTLPGDTVFVMNGTYHSASGAVLSVTRSGSEGKYITFKAFKGHKPKITASENVWNAVSINGSFVVFEGFELMGNNANITYEAAFKAYNDNVNGTAGPQAKFNTNALTVGGPRAESKFPHHVVVRDCRVHDFPGGGINAIQTDYMTIENNVVYNNAWYMQYAGSGISILTPFNSDKVTSYRNIIRNNICNNNKTTIPWISLKRMSDGNGIIIDVNQHAYDEQDATTPSANAYLGRTLVENNISFNNGGSGIHTFKADHVDIINNTAYHNGTVMDYPDIFSNACQDVNIINNIMYSRQGGKSNSKPKNATEKYDHNIYFNGTVGYQGENDIVADPKFLNVSTELLAADFRLTAASPAVNAGSNVNGFFSLSDILGVARPQGIRPDRGAYEFTGENIVTGIVNLPVKEKATIFPNPANDNLLIRVPLSGVRNGKIEILDCNGTRIREIIKISETNTVNIRGLAKGVFLVVISQNDRTISIHKFVKQ